MIDFDFDKLSKYTHAKLKQDFRRTMQKNHGMFVQLIEAHSGLGIPDAFLQHEWFGAWVELKVPPDKPSRVQLRWKRKLEKAGGIWVCLYSCSKEETVLKCNELAVNLDKTANQLFL